MLFLYLLIDSNFSKFDIRSAPKSTLEFNYMKSPIKVDFKNQVRPNSSFDLIKLEDLVLQRFEEHDPKQLHLVKFFIFLFITDGSGKHKVDFTNYTYKKGSLITIRKDQIHQFYKGNKPKGYVLLFTEDFLISYLESFEAHKSLQLFNEHLGRPKLNLSGETYQSILQLIHRIEKEYYNQEDDYSLGIIRSELHILITKLYRIKSKLGTLKASKKYLEMFILLQEKVEEGVTESNKVLDYAKALGLSTKTLNTVTRSTVNKTAKEFIDEIHIKQIKRLLINTSDSVKEIAFQTGFEETTNFYKYFKRQVGLTPEQFRSKL